MDHASLLELIGRLALAAALGGLVGWERESHGRAAGLRTMILVCTGACLIMITSLDVYRLFRHLDVNSVVRLDPARIAYGVITGIGFLGAGAIIRQEDRVRGLTTAACLWLVTAVGLAVGCGFYIMALTATTLAYATLVLLKSLERFANPDTYNTLKVVADETLRVDQLRGALQPMRIKILSYRMERDVVQRNVTVELDLRYRETDIAEKAVTAVAALRGVNFVAWR